jgi:2-keto-4-pentenoate hydratase/2-oxohepta-3-ene-1,7-dioic acid hydratase in catechol pathway
VKWARIEVGGAPLKVLAREGRLVAEDGRSFAAEGAKFLPPVLPGNFYAAGLNFRAHIDWANRHHGTSYKAPVQADIGYRSNNALVGSGADIVIPADSTGPVEYEGELVAVIGRKARSVSEEKALDCVAGYTLGRAKNADTFKPMGPFVVSGIDPMNQDIEVRINGSAVSRYNTRGMIFGVAHYISRMSRYLTLYPDDVIWFGCDGHTVPALQPGDVVEVANDAIGVLRNRVVREKSGSGS